jgi:hypothetical protein
MYDILHFYNLLNGIVSILNDHGGNPSMLYIKLDIFNEHNTIVYLTVQVLDQHKYNWIQPKSPIFAVFCTTSRYSDSKARLSVDECLSTFLKGIKPTNIFFLSRGVSFVQFFLSWHSTNTLSFTIVYLVSNK